MPNLRELTGRCARSRGNGAEITERLNQDVHQKKGGNAGRRAFNALVDTGRNILGGSSTKLALTYRGGVVLSLDPPMSQG